MVNAQEYVNSLYPTKEERGKVEKLDVFNKNLEGHLDLSEFGGLTYLFCSSNNLTSLDLSKNVNLTRFLGSSNNLTSLDLSKNVNLTYLYCHVNNLTSLDLSKNVNLTTFNCSSNNFTSTDFLNTLPNPEKLEELSIFNNNIQPTDIAVFSKFVNIKKLKVGNAGSSQIKHNRFYGSLKAYQNLTKLEVICIEATDVNEGLEYLPFSLAQNTAKLAQSTDKQAKREKDRGGYYRIECSPHDTQAKCSAIQNELRPFNYDLEAWQLAHPKLMTQVWKERYFVETYSKDKLLTSLTDKITNSQKELQTVKEQEADKLSKIARLETKIKELELTKSALNKQTQTEFSTQNKSTQTDLTGEQIKRLEEKNKKTLYQKFTEKHGK